jgi:hypothetical protein
LYIYIYQQQVQLRLLLLLLLLTVCPKRPHHALFPFLPHLCARANSLPPLPSLPSYPTLSQLRLPAPISVPPSPHPTKFFTASRTFQHLSFHLPMFPHLICHPPQHRLLLSPTTRSTAFAKQYLQALSHTASRLHAHLNLPLCCVNLHILYCCVHCNFSTHICVVDFHSKFSIWLQEQRPPLHSIAKKKFSCARSSFPLLYLLLTPPRLILLLLPPPHPYLRSLQLQQPVPSSASSFAFPAFASTLASDAATTIDTTARSRSSGNNFLSFAEAV